MRGMRPGIVILLALMLASPGLGAATGTAQDPHCSPSVVEDHLTDPAVWAGRFSDPTPSAYPQPIWVIGKELTATQIGRELDLFAGHGYCTIVVVPSLGPPYQAEEDDLRRPVLGNFWSQMGTILDEASARNIRIWFQTFQKLDKENAVLEQHPRFRGRVLVERSRGEEYDTEESGYDRLDPDATDALIDGYFGEFERRFPGHFGTTLIGFWDDESVINTAAVTGDARPWSEALPSVFLEEKGYRIDVPDRQQWLFHGDHPEARQTRTDYWDVVSGLFVNHFGRMRGWLEDRGMQLVVQPLADNAQLTDDMNMQGSYFRMQSGASIPGADMLRTDDDQGGIGNDWYGMVLKQTSSAARLTGRVEAQHEPFGHGQPSLNLMRYYMDRAFVRGITFIQTAFYIQRDASPADVNESILAPDLFHDNVQWPDQPVWAQYTARLRTMLAGATPATEVLLLYPVTTFWAQDPEGEAPDFTTRTYMNVGTALIDGHRAWDVGWEEMLADPDTVVDSGRIRRGDLSWGTVVLPAADTITNETAQRLRDLVDAGGHVLAVSRIPHRSAQGDDTFVRDAMQHVFGHDPQTPMPDGVTRNTHASGGTGITTGVDLGSSFDYREETRERYAQLWDALDPVAPAVAELSEENLNQTSTLTSSVGTIETGQGHTANEILHVRKHDRDVYFVTNYPDGHERFSLDLNLTPLSHPALDTVLSVPVAEGVPQIWDPETGTVGDAVAWWRTGDGWTHVELHLPPQGGLGVVFRDGDPGCRVTAAGTGVERILTGSDQVQIEALWRAEPHELSVPVACGEDVLDITLTSDVELADVPVPGPWDFDLRPFRTLASPGSLPGERRGPGSWTEADLLGPGLPHIGVTGTGSYTSGSDLLGNGYGGLRVPASYLRPDVRLELDLGTVRELASVWVAGEPAGRRLWPPFRFDVTDLVSDGDNELRVDVTNSMESTVPGFVFSPVKHSGLLTEPVLVPRVVVTGTAGVN